MRKKKITLPISKFLTVVAFLIVIYAIFGLSKTIWQSYKINKRMKSLEKETEYLDAENTKLSNLIDYYKTETYKEKEARRLLGYQKPGEKVVIIPEVEEEIQEEEKQNGQNQNTEETNKDNYQKWLDFFFAER